MFNNISTTGATRTRNEGGDDMELGKVVEVHMTPYEMFDRLSQENKEKVIHLIDLLIASQSKDRQEHDSRQ